MNIYLLKNEIYSTEDEDDLPRWVICFDAVAFFCFWVAHWLYVSTFLKVVIKAPEVFGEKNKNKNSKTTCAFTILLMIDLTLYIAVFAYMVYRMIKADSLASNYAQPYW